jgi:hypothetical protein
MVKNENKSAVKVDKTTAAIAAVAAVAATVGVGQGTPIAVCDWIAVASVATKHSTFCCTSARKRHFGFWCFTAACELLPSYGPSKVVDQATKQERIDWRRSYELWQCIAKLAVLVGLGYKGTDTSSTQLLAGNELHKTNAMLRYAKTCWMIGIPNAPACADVKRQSDMQKSYKEGMEKYLAYKDMVVALLKPIVKDGQLLPIEQHPLYVVCAGKLKTKQK